MLEIPGLPRIYLCYLKGPCKVRLTLLIPKLGIHRFEYPRMPSPWLESLRGPLGCDRWEPEVPSGYSWHHSEEARMPPYDPYDPVWPPSKIL